MHNHNHQHHVHETITSVGDVFSYAAFSDLWSPFIIMLSVAILVLYFLTIGPWRNKFKDSSPVSSGQVALFVAGIVLFYLAQGSPINYFGHHYLFSSHMLQMSIMYIMMPPLLILGIPNWVYRSLFSRKMVEKAFNALAHPAIAIILFNFLISMYHLPYIFDNMMANHLYHTIYHSAITVGAFLMWWPIVCPLPEMNTLTSLKKIAYIFISGVMLTPVCVLIIFASQPIYSVYMDAPQLFRHLPILDDQQLGGVIMKVIQELTYILTIAIVFYRWAFFERKTDAIDPVPEHIQSYGELGAGISAGATDPSYPTTTTSTPK